MKKNNEDLETKIKNFEGIFNATPSRYKLNSFTKLDSLDIGILEALEHEENRHAYQLVKLLKQSKSVISRRLDKLEEINLIKRKKVGMLTILEINQKKKEELKNIKEVYQKCNFILENPNLYLLRIHDFSFYTYCSNIDKKDYTKDKYKEVKAPKLSFHCIKCDLAHINYYPTNETILVYLKPFYIPYHKGSPEGIEPLLYYELFRRYNQIEEFLENKGISLGGGARIIFGSIALPNYDLANEAIKARIKTKNVDESIPGIPEIERHKHNSPKEIEKLLDFLDAYVSQDKQLIEFLKSLKSTPNYNKKEVKTCRIIKN